VSVAGRSRIAHQEVDPDILGDVDIEKWADDLDTVLTEVVA
jgi:hypothetical protein